jgi:serine/threonine-protein phosphatase 6 regulatory ankyrin repeat subunit A
MLAAGQGNVQGVTVLMGAKAEMEMHDRNGFTAAHHAAKRGHAECVNLLLDAGSSVLAVDCMGQMLIHLAAYNGDASMVENLLERGCPANGGPLPDALLPAELSAQVLLRLNPSIEQRQAYSLREHVIMYRTTTRAGGHSTTHRS